MKKVAGIKDKYPKGKEHEAEKPKRQKQSTSDIAKITEEKHTDGEIRNRNVKATRRRGASIHCETHHN